MKTSKPTVQTSAQEECGVWLDTVQLKGKAKQKRLARPISKLLNPFAQGGGYSLAVALSFTQTEMEMPKTKQSSLSNYFTPHRRVLNKMSASEVPNIDPVQPVSLSTSTTSTTVASGRKRGRDSYHEESDSHKPEEDHEWNSENVAETEATLQKQITNLSPLQNIYYESEEDNLEEFKSPESKRRLTDASYLPGDSQPLPQAWSQDPLLTYSQYCESEFYQPSQENTTEKNLNHSEPSFLNTLQSERAFGNLMHLDARTSTQKSFKHLHSSQSDNEKENSKSLSCNSPSKHSPFSHLGPLSNHKWAEPKTVSPRKHKGQLWKKAEKEGVLDSKWTKPICSPLKKRAPQQRIRDVDDDSLAMLFTQDSEGFRVIAHRGLQTRSPLKDQSNVSTGVVRTNACKSLVVEEEEAEDDMLFTQDSQGNVVIKH